MKNKNRVCNFSLILLFLFTRLFLIDGFPRGLNCDEASATYEAYSILKTGCDRVGNLLPCMLVDFGAGKSALYTYILIPFVKFFGVNIFVTRLPMAMFSIIAFFIVYKLASESFSINDFQKNIIILLFTISPVLIMRARFGLEVNLFPYFFILSFYFLYKFALSIVGYESEKDTSKLCQTINIILGSIFVGLSAYCYSTSYVFLPVFMFLYYLYIIKHTKHTRQIVFKILLSLFTILLIVWPLILYITINFFDLPQINLPFLTIPKLYSNRMVNESIISKGNFLINILSNIFELFKLIILQNDHLIWNSIPHIGMYYYISVPFLIIGMYLSFKRTITSHKVNSNANILNDLILIWFVSGIIFSLFLKGININRINILLYPLLYFIIYGIVYAFARIKKLIIPVLCVYLLSFGVFVYKYINIIPTQYMNNTFSYSIEKVVEYTKQYKDSKIYFDDIIREPYINVLYYLSKDGKFNPKEFTKTVVYKNGRPDFKAVTSFSNWHFVKMNPLFFTMQGKISPDCIFITSMVNESYLKSIGLTTKIIDTYCVARVN